MFFFAHNFSHEKISGDFWKDSFTFLAGPIFRQKNEEKESLTFGIDIGFENTVYDSDILDSFTTRVRVGVPFNIYEKKK